MSEPTTSTHSRLADEFTYCTTTTSGGTRDVTVTFDESGTVSSTD